MKHTHHWNPNDKRTDTIKNCPCGAQKRWNSKRWVVIPPRQRKGTPPTAKAIKDIPCPGCGCYKLSYLLKNPFDQRDRPEKDLTRAKCRSCDKTHILSHETRRILGTLRSALAAAA